MGGQSFDLYAPYQLPTGKFIYGAAAANKRVADAGGFNEFSFAMLNFGAQMGYQQAVNNFRAQRRGN